MSGVCVVAIFTPRSCLPKTIRLPGNAYTLRMHIILSPSTGGTEVRLSHGRERFLIHVCCQTLCLIRNIENASYVYVQSTHNVTYIHCILPARHPLFSRTRISPVTVVPTAASFPCFGWTTGLAGPCAQTMTAGGFSGHF